ncbi:MAG TPA: M56 family metallopeptidase [Longimicrobium sp.]|nr:M56 family metallopeptidase [Longimicrobium sp.]
MNRDVLVFAAGWALVHSLWQCTLIALGLRIALAAVPARAAAARYWLCCAALAAMLVSTAATAWSAARAAPAGLRAASTIAEARTAVPAPAAPRPPRLDGAAPLRALRPTVVALGGARAAWDEAARGVVRWFPALVTLWALGVALFSARLWGGWWLVRRLVRIGVAPPPAAVAAVLERLRRTIGVSRPVRLLTSARVHVPTVVGWLRPVILLPVSALTGLTPRQIELLILHELAHVRRHDHLVAVLQAVAEAALFHHPAAWWASARIREAREHCCDDLVASLEGVRDYVDALASMEAARRRLPALALAADGASLASRVRRLVEARAQRPSSAPRLAAGGVLLAVAALLFVPGGGRAAAGAEAPTPARLRPARAGAPGCTSASAGTTLCPALVSAAERALSARAGGGVVLVQDVRTGAVLVNSAAGTASTETEAPGSVWKLVLATLWWDQGMGDDGVRCTPEIRVGGRTIRTASRAGSRGAGVHEMLVVSCNTSAVRMALALRDRLGPAGLARELSRIGFPVAAPGAAGGGRDDAFWAGTASPGPSPRRPDVALGDGDAAGWAALGLGDRTVRVTPLHLSRFVQSIGNGGVMLAPTLDPSVAAARADGRRVMTAGTAARLRSAMLDVVRRGTAARAGQLLAGSAWRLGGKTGTLNHPGHGQDGWFAGLAFDASGAPRYALVVFLPESGSGGGEPARLAAELTTRMAAIP